MTGRRFTCAVCGHPCTEVHANVIVGDVLIRVPVLLCTSAPCVAARGGTATPMTARTRDRD